MLQTWQDPGPELASTALLFFLLTARELFLRQDGGVPRCWGDVACRWLECDEGQSCSDFRIQNSEFRGRYLYRGYSALDSNFQVERQEAIKIMSGQAHLERGDVDRTGRSLSVGAHLDDLKIRAVYPTPLNPQTTWGMGKCISCPPPCGTLDAGPLELFCFRAC